MLKHTQEQLDSLISHIESISNKLRVVIRPSQKSVILQLEDFVSKAKREKTVTEKDFEKLLKLLERFNKQLVEEQEKLIETLSSTQGDID
ncbi:hypothetical protein [Aliarcobacter skirrowii]|uniref:hypothetical protein n=1 Tax=Aliarcobacter skirrowii TaxID=28200 RepID=UPI0029B97446|nr:hypothetical protein [Aliarcobacter skirrowii]MDX4028348.1 hypothetical protein [Aliarcobacter skirrowii]